MEMGDNESVNSSPKKYYTKTHESWKDTGERAGSHVSNNNLKTLRQVKIDSAALMKEDLKNSVRNRDSVTIHKINK